MNKRLTTYRLFATIAILCICLRGQCEIVIEPLFQYPTAPDSVLTLNDRSNFLMNHFWDEMNFTTTKAVDQNALNDAFSVYVSAMRFADSEEARKSVDQILQRLQKNPVLSIQFTRAAEESLYGPRAEVWSDGVYMRFLEAIIKNKKVSKDKKLRFIRHSELLKNSMVGATPPSFDYTTVKGSRAHYHPNGVITVIEFGNPDCDECRFSKLKMETDVAFNNLIDRGLVNVLFIIPDAGEGWEEEVNNYSSKWHIGASDTVADLYDMRATPSIYVIDNHGKVAAKNITAEQAIAIVTEITPK